MTHFIQTHLWLLYALITLSLTWLINAIANHIFTRLIDKAKKTKIIYDEALLVAFHSPISLTIWLFGFFMAASFVIHANAYLWFAPYLNAIKKTGVIFAITWALLRLVKQTEHLYIAHHTKKKRDIDKTLINASAQLLTIIIMVLGVMGVMQILNIPIAGLLAFGGIGGAGVAFAAKDLLANFFGGLVIYLDRPFKVGDWVRSPDKNIEGFVEYIGWRVTRIRTLERRPLYVPNGLFLTIIVENASRIQHRRLRTTIGIRYQDAPLIKTICEQIKTMILNHPQIDSALAVSVSLVECSASSLSILLYAFSKTTAWTDFNEVQQDILMNALQIIADNGAECSFPTQSLFLENEVKVKLT